MIRKRISVSTVLDTRYTRADGRHGVKIRVTYKRTQKYFPLNVWLTPEEWAKVYTGRDAASLQRKSYFTQAEASVRAAADSLHPFDFDLLGQAVYGEQVDESCLYVLLEQKAQAAKPRTADGYRSALSHVRKYEKAKTLPLAKVTSEWLRRYESWAMANGLSQNSVWAYMKCIRAVFNDALADGLVKTTPFGPRKYQLKYVQPAKRSLSLADVRKFIDYKPVNDYEAYAKDMWMFSYLCAGINLLDMAKLTVEHVKDGVLSFQRTKTQGRWVHTPVHQQALAIIDKYANERHANYLLPIDKGHGQVKSTQNAMNRINGQLKKIAGKIKIEPFTFYAARHTFATVLRQKGVAVEFISEAMGHSDIKTTQGYLDRFTVNQYQHNIDKLTDF